MNTENIKLLTQAGIGVLALAVLAWSMWLGHQRGMQEIRVLEQQVEALTLQNRALVAVAETYTGKDID